MPRLMACNRMRSRLLRRNRTCGLLLMTHGRRLRKHLRRQQPNPDNPDTPAHTSRLPSHLLTLRRIPASHLWNPSPTRTTTGNSIPSNLIPSLFLKPLRAPLDTPLRIETADKTSSPGHQPGFAFNALPTHPYFLKSSAKSLFLRTLSQKTRGRVSPQKPASQP